MLLCVRFSNTPHCKTLHRQEHHPRKCNGKKMALRLHYRIIPDGIGCLCPPNTDFPRNCWRLFCLAPFCLRTRVPRRICSGFALQHLFQQVHLRCVMRFCPLNTVCTHIAVVMCVQKMSWISCSLARAGSFGHVLRWRDSASSMRVRFGFPANARVCFALRFNILLLLGSQSERQSTRRHVCWKVCAASIAFFCTFLLVASYFLTFLLVLQVYIASEQQSDVASVARFVTCCVSLFFIFSRRLKYFPSLAGWTPRQLRGSVRETGCRLRNCLGLLCCMLGCCCFFNTCSSRHVRLV